MIRLTPALARKLVKNARGLYEHPQTGQAVGVFLTALDIEHGRIQAETLDRAHRHWVPLSRIRVEDPALELERATQFIKRAQALAGRLDARWKKGDPRR